MDNQYKTSLSSLFSSVAREVPVRFVLHWDNANTCWNVFKKHGVREDYICSFLHLPDAQQYVNQMNDIDEE